MTIPEILLTGFAWAAIGAAWGFRRQAQMWQTIAISAITEAEKILDIVKRSNELLKKWEDVYANTAIATVLPEEEGDDPRRTTDTSYLN